MIEQIDQFVAAIVYVRHTNATSVIGHFNDSVIYMNRLHELTTNAGGSNSVSEY